MNWLLLVLGLLGWLLELLLLLRLLLDELLLRLSLHGLLWLLLLLLGLADLLHVLSLLGLNYLLDLLHRDLLLDLLVLRNMHRHFLHGLTRVLRVLLLLPPPRVLFLSAPLLLVLCDAFLDISLEVTSDNHWKLGQLKGIVLPFILFGVFSHNLDNAFRLGGS